MQEDPLDDHDRPKFSVDQIDHVELFVPDRRDAADWYRQVLGLTIVGEYEHWAKDRQGPLMISSDGGSTKLALFEGRPQGDREAAGWHLVAFRVSENNFERFLGRLDELTLTDHHGETVSRDSVKDHGLAHSIYFNDPYGHRLELTTYVEDDIEVLDPTEAIAPDVDLPSTDQNLWLCHGCNTPVPAKQGAVCSVCYRSTCSNCLAPGGGDKPVCKGCLGQPGP
jgi:catechol 2,3-dioxygenase-like lactoylglutathione lyase family enzyme